MDKINQYHFSLLSKIFVCETTYLFHLLSQQYIAQSARAVELITDYSFIAIAPRSTLARRVSTW